MHNKFSQLSIAVACIAWLPLGIAASTVYTVDVNTSSIAGTGGYLDLQFEPGTGVTNLATATVSNFSTNGALFDAAALTGDVTGQLPGLVAFDNQTVFNDSYQSIRFGTNLSFVVALAGPTPLGGSPSAFNIAFYSTDFIPVPLLTVSPDGIAGQIILNPDGSTTPIVFDASAISGPALSVTTTPELATLASLSLGVVLVLLVRPRHLRQNGAFLAFLSFAIPLAIHAQTVTATLPLATPYGLVVNSLTNKIYANSNGNVVAIDGATNSITTVAANISGLMALNPLTNRLYVLNNSSNSVTVVDLATNATTTVPTGPNPNAVEVNQVVNKIYILNGTTSVTIINGATNNTKTIAVGSAYSNYLLMAVTSAATYLAGNYVATKIDASTDEGYSFGILGIATAISANPATGSVYVTLSNSSYSSSVYDLTTASPVFTWHSGVYINSLAVNPVTNEVYVGGNTGPSYFGGFTYFIVINIATNTTRTVDGTTGPFTIDSVTNKVYTIDTNRRIVFFDGVTGAATILPDIPLANEVAVNPVTNKLYAVVSGGIAVIDATTTDNSTIVVPTEGAPKLVFVNPGANKVYAMFPEETTFCSPGISECDYDNYWSATVIDGATNGTDSVSFNTGGELTYSPLAIVNPITNLAYVFVGYWGNVSIVDGATNYASTQAPTQQIAGFNPLNWAINPVTNKIYEYKGGDITEVDATTFSQTPLGSLSPESTVVVNPATNEIYVGVYGDRTTITEVVDGATYATETLGGGTLIPLAVNSVTDKIYLATGQGTLTLAIVDGVTNNITTLSVPVESVMVNEITNKIYLPGNPVTVVDGATNAVSALPVAGSNVAIDQLTNKIYIHDNGSTVSVVDGATNVVSSFSVLTGPGPIIVNAATNKLYFFDSTAGGVTVVSDPRTEPNSLTTAITPLPGNTTETATPTFTFNASSTTTAQPNAVFFQVDTWQNTWLAAGGSNPLFTGTVPPYSLAFTSYTRTPPPVPPRLQ